MDLLDLLPHRPPMRLLDAIVELVPKQRASGHRDLRPDDFFFDGHFPGEPVVPAVILVEMIAQLGGLAAGAPDDRSVGAPPLRLRVAALGPCKFPNAATPGLRLMVDARVAGTFAGLHRIEGEITANGRVVAEGSLTLAQAPPPSLSSA
jgi:3-hydroxyacyl-[acyl-carrier-protein] dehydratase